MSAWSRGRRSRPAANSRTAAADRITSTTQLLDLTPPMNELPAIPGSRPTVETPRKKKAHRREPGKIAEDVLRNPRGQEQQEEDDPRAARLQELFDPLKLGRGDTAATKGLPRRRDTKNAAVEPSRMPDMDSRIPRHPPKR